MRYRCGACACSQGHVHITCACLTSGLYGYSQALKKEKEINTTSIYPETSPRRAFIESELRV